MSHGKKHREYKNSKEAQWDAASKDLQHEDSGAVKEYIQKLEAKRARRKTLQAFYFDPTRQYIEKEHLIRFTAVHLGRSVAFKAWVTEFSDQFQSSWNSEEVYGRMDPIQTFKSTKRVIQLSWDVVAASEHEAITNMKNSNTLLRFLYPRYNGAALSAPPLLRLKFANLVHSVGSSHKGLLGTVEGFNYTPDFEAGVFDSTKGKIYPKVIKFTCSFTALHEAQMDAGTVGVGESLPHFPHHVGAKKTRMSQGLPLTQEHTETEKHLLDNAHSLLEAKLAHEAYKAPAIAALAATAPAADDGMPDSIFLADEPAYPSAAESEIHGSVNVNDSVTASDVPLTAVPLRDSFMQDVSPEAALEYATSGAAEVSGPRPANDTLNQLGAMQVVPNQAQKEASEGFYNAGKPQPGDGTARNVNLFPESVINNVAQGGAGAHLPQTKHEIGPPGSQSKAPVTALPLDNSPEVKTAQAAEKDRQDMRDFRANSTKRQQSLELPLEKTVFNRPSTVGTHDPSTEAINRQMHRDNKKHNLSTLSNNARKRTDASNVASQHTGQIDRLLATDYSGSTYNASDYRRTPTVQDHVDSISRSNYAASGLRSSDIRAVSLPSGTENMSTRELIHSRQHPGQKRGFKSLRYIKGKGYVAFYDTRVEGWGDKY